MKSRAKTLPPVALKGLGFPARLQVLENKLTATDRKVGEYFLGYPEAAYLSITEVVEQSGLGYGSVIRFSKKMGCDGFQAFKVLLAQELRVLARDRASDGGDRITRYTADIREELANTEKLIDRDVVARTARKLNSAGRVLVTGIAGSASVAIGFDYRLSRLGIHSSVVCEGYNLLIRAASLGPRDVFVAVSFSGATKDILAAAKIARKHSATVVSLTNFVHAPLVERADLALCTASARDPLACEIFSNVAASFVLDVVFNELFRIRKNARETVDRTFRAVSDRRV